jgi:alkylation response protein AidB-like acyl-CoA dehydrogenase
MSSFDREVTRRKLLTSISEIEPILMECAEGSDIGETLSRSAVDALRDAGLFSLKTPHVLGGYEADPMLQMEVIEAVSYIHPASGWCTMVGAGSAAGPAAYLPDAGIDAVYKNGRMPTFAGSFAPAGSAISVDGGYRVSGRWRFASGVRHSEWVHAGARVADGGSPGDASLPSVIQVIIPTTDIEILDTWHVMGLRGTGSCDFTISNLFVKDSMTYAANNVSTQPQRGGHLYRLAVPAFFAGEHIGFAAGVARRALDELATMATTTRGQFRSTSLSERHVVHRILGEYDIKLRAVRALAFEYYEGLWKRLCDGEPIGKDLQTQSRAIATYITELAVDATIQAFRYGGAGALFQPNTLELLMRDMNAAAQHIMVSDNAYEDHGRLVLGLTDE